MFTHGLQNVAHLLALPLSTNVRTNPFLQEFETPLVLGNTQQLHSTFLIRRKAGDFSNQVTNELVVVGLLAFVVRGLPLYFIESGLVTFVKASAHFVLGRHAKQKQTVLE